MVVLERRGAKDEHCTTVAANAASNECQIRFGEKEEGWQRGHSALYSLHPTT